MIGREDEIRHYRDRVGLVRVFAVLGFLIIVARLVFLQVIKGDELRKFSDNNRLKKERLFASRGVIYDRHGKVIVDNRASFDVVLLSQYYSFEDEDNDRLAKALDMPREELDRKLTKVAKNPSYVPVLLKSDVPEETLAAIEMDAKGFRGVDIEVNVQRRYPYGDISSQILGYIGEVDPRDVKDKRKGFQAGDYIGKMGLERYLDPDLRGQNGVGYVEVDAMGRRKNAESSERVLGFVQQTDPLPGNNVYLTLDMELSQVAAKGLRDRNFNGTIVAMDPRSGEILTMISYPSFEASKISGREVNPKVWASLSTDKERPLRNRAVQDHYPPGSTFKLFVALAALAEGVAKPSRTMTCNGQMYFGNRFFNCWKRHGTVDFAKSIKESCDVYYYTLGNELGVDRIAKYARMFGFGAQTEVPLPSEVKGLIPDSEWKERVYKDKWHPGETLSVAIGQGYVDVSPIQLVTGFAAIGNGGFVYRPYLVRRLETLSGSVIRETAPKLQRKIDLAPEMFEVVKSGLEKVVNEAGGTAFLSRSKKTILSGKTGTAQVRNFADIRNAKCENLPMNYRHHGLFVGYAPKDNPEIAIVAVAEHGCHGSSAAPIVRDMVDNYFGRQQALADGSNVVSDPLTQTAPSPTPAAVAKVKETKPAVRESASTSPVPDAKPPEKTENEKPAVVEVIPEGTDE